MMLVCAIFSAPAGWARGPEPATSAFRFGDWLLLVPGEVSAKQLDRGAVQLQLGSKRLDFLLYWQGGKRRSVALRFDNGDSGKDRAVQRSDHVIEALQDCDSRRAASLPELRGAEARLAYAAELPDGASIRIGDTGRGIQRVGEELIADLGRYRFKIALDSPVTRLGMPNSGDFCSYDLEPQGRDDD